mgnify:CR=1 FL=1
MTENLINILTQEKIFPVIRSKDFQTATDIAKALADGGIEVMEIVVENPSIYKAIEKISEFAYTCAGGIITTMQADAAIQSGAKIISSPIFSMNLVKSSKDKKVPFIPGTSSANEAYSAWKARMPIIKIYPITAMGGVNYIENIIRPMPFLNLIAQGNVKLNEVKSYIEAGAKAVGVGRDFYENCSLNEIKLKAEKIINELKG